MKSQGIHVPLITVTESEASHFIRCVTFGIEAAKKWRSRKLHVLDYDNKAVVVSLDGYWIPFLGFSYGYNQPEDRVDLPGGVRIIEKVGELLENRGLDQPGGRIFINKNQAFHMIDGQLHTLCTFTWNGLDPFRDIARKMRDY